MQIFIYSMGTTTWEHPCFLKAQDKNDQGPRKFSSVSKKIFSG